MAHRVAASNVFGESPRRLGIDHFVDPEDFQDLTSRGFAPLGIVNRNSRPKDNVLKTLLADTEHYIAVPAKLSDQLVCIEGLVCLFGRHERSFPSFESPELDDREALS